MDEFSRKVWIFTLKSKAEAPDKIIEFFTYLNNQFKDYTIKIFKSDGGKEYKNKKINKYCKENGIEKVYSSLYFPEINGKAEKINNCNDINIDNYLVVIVWIIIFLNIIIIWTYYYYLFIKIFYF